MSTSFFSDEERSNRVVEHVIDVVLGKRELNPFFKELKQYIKDKYEINVLDFYISNEYEKLNGKVVIAMIICKVFSAKRKINDISKKMLELNKKYGFIDEDKIYPYIGAADFRETYRYYCTEKSSKEAIPYLKDKYKEYSINDIECNCFIKNLSVYYNYNKDVKDNEKNGISEKITMDFYKIIKKYDVLDFITDTKYLIDFFSRQDIDENYGGNFYQYFM